MKDNKLIAEFMGVPQGEHTHFMVEPFALESYANVDDLKYDISWDWLMPVVQKCYETEVVVQPAVEGGCSGLITFSLIGLPCMESTYNAVVKFINEHNKYICGSCGDHVNEVVFNEDTDVDECTNCIQ
tara:strand:+ start:638 stop:1021 length:384 start_codon:yes stop_codon:yes gene_type:complete